MVDLDGTKWNQVFDVLEDWEQILKGSSYDHLNKPEPEI